jgi:hypothetical protein
VIAAGSAAIAAVLKREDAQRVMQVVAGISAIVAIMMSPSLLATKVLFVVGVLAVGTVMLWGDTHQNRTLWPLSQRDRWRAEAARGGRAASLGTLRAASNAS